MDINRAINFYAYIKILLVPKDGMIFFTLNFFTKLQLRIELEIYVYLFFVLVPITLQ